TVAAGSAERGPLSVGPRLEIGRELMRALQSVHDQGLLHGDVKPANVILGEGSPPGRVTLIDFGFARYARLELSTHDLPLGTLAYLSPEQAGLIHTEVAERSDLSPAGILLFECLAGRPPFVGPTVGEVLRQHLSAPCPDLRALRRGVPGALDEVIQRLLCKDPRDRYQSAPGVLADLD